MRAGRFGSWEEKRLHPVEELVHAVQEQNKKAMEDLARSSAEMLAEQRRYGEVRRWEDSVLSFGKSFNFAT